MPKKSTGYTPDRSKGNPLAKQSTPFKVPSVKEPTLDKLPKVTANLNFKPGSISKPAKLTPRTPKI